LGAGFAFDAVQRDGLFGAELVDRGLDASASCGMSKV
jgi:hypothetical protein